MSQLTLNEAAAPGTPSAGKVTLYAKSDGLLYWKDDAGTEYLLPVVATQALQEAAASLVSFVSPGRQQFHPSACKGWCQVNNAAGIAASHNVSGCVDTATGRVEVDWGTDFSSANYSQVASVYDGVGTDLTCHIEVASISAGGTIINCTYSGASADPTGYFIAAFGDQP